MQALDLESIAHAAELIAQSDALIVAAGAGMGVDSDLPDFRGKAGFWQAYPALGREQVDFHRIACPEAFRTHPARAWGFYGHRRNRYRATEPHPGFHILKRWGQAMHHGYSVYTSNVDGQFQKAGFDPDVIHECHGSLHHLQCLKLCHNGIWAADAVQPEVDEDQCLLLNAAPTCPRCGGLARPNVLMFTDFEWLTHRQRAQARRMEDWLAGVQAPVVVEVGAGTAIPSVREFSQRVIYEFGGRLIRINPAESSVPIPFDVGFAAGAAETLMAIDRALGLIDSSSAAQ